MQRVFLIAATLVAAIHVPSTADAVDLDDNVFTRFSVGSQYLGLGGAIGLSNFDDEDYDGGDPSGGVTLRFGGGRTRAFRGSWRRTTSSSSRRVTRGRCS